jgi:2-oxo-4-hydroxy-4-carboxy--5-ureidoimidazoline (OHCU) decarboxylase
MKARERAFSASTMSLAPLSSNADDLLKTLSLLFEPSPILVDGLVPQLSNALSAQPRPDSYASLIDSALAQVMTWEPSQRAQFIAGHPRIGAVKIASGLSVKEQGATSTSPETIALLADLNAQYERHYPGLRYITFVNGRSREAIAEEMQMKLATSDTVVLENSDAWVAEVDRAVGDVGLIAKSRLKGLGVEQVRSPHIQL